ncbi:MAG: alpha/beta hydrolase [Calditrichota bacterium]
MLFVELPDYRLHYSQFGSGTPVVFLHGLSFDSRMWTPQYEVLADEFMAIGLDFRGHGFSSAPDIKYSLDTYVADISTLLNSMHLTSAVLVGLSLGGAVALDFAMRYPLRVRALILASSALNGYNWSKAWQEVMRRVRQANTMQSFKINLREYWLNDPMFAGVRSKKEYAYLLTAMAGSFSGKPILNGDLQSKTFSNDPDRLNRIKCPVCVINGERDRSDFQDIARQLATKIRRVEWHQLPGVGHMVNLEAPDEFNRIVKSFLYRVEAEGI